MKILFMCVANSARSQMAEGLARTILGPEHEIQSAGSHPSKVNPFAIQAMQEIGIDITEHYSKSINELPPEFIGGIDYVITLCAEEVCPIMTTKAKKLHWPFLDPATSGVTDEERLTAFRRVCGEIRSRINEFFPC